MTNFSPDLTPSARLVLDILRGAETPMTMRQIILSSPHGRRTVYQALRDLVAAGLIKSRPSFKDTRQNFYWATGPSPKQIQSMNEAAEMRIFRGDM